MLINRYLKYLIIFIIAILGWGCSTKNNCYTDFRNIPTEGWKKNEPVTFMINDSILDKADITLTLRHNNLFPYHDMYLLADFINKDGTTTSSVIECNMANNSGKWEGNGFGSLYELNKDIQSDIKIRDLSQIRIWQNMNDSIINGITEIGITIFESK